MANQIKDDVLAKINDHGIELIRFLYTDLSGQVRGKLTSSGTFAERSKTGIGLVKGMMAMNMLDKMQTDTGLGATGEVRLVPDLDTFRLVPYTRSSASVICDLVQLDHMGWSLCPRELLRRQLADANTLGFSIQAAFETEYMLGEYGQDGSYTPLDTNVCFGTDAMDRADAFYTELYECLSRQGIQIEQFYPELGHGQHEISIKHASAMEACDRYLAVKESLRGLATAAGFFFTAAPKPFEDQPGNGCHLHLSIWDKEMKQNLTWSKEGDGLSDIARYFIAGLVSHLPALVSVTCPSVNSYRRLKPKSWSSAYACWGYDNREAAVRVPSVYWGKEEESTNIEIKCVDSTINPHLAMAAVVASGLDGIMKKMEPPPPVAGDPADLSPEAMERHQVVRLPQSLDKALVELETDIYLMKMLGPELANVYITVKTSEVNAFALDSDFEYAQHRLRF